MAYAGVNGSSMILKEDQEIDHLVDSNDVEIAVIVSVMEDGA